MTSYQVTPPNGNNNNNNNNNLFGDSEDDDNEIDEEEQDSDSAASHSPSTTTITTPTPLPPVTAAVTPPTTEIITPQPTPKQQPDDSRKLFQRLWTDEDEIGLLRGFLDHNTQQRQQNPSYHIDNAVFYDHIKNRLQLDFNKNQLVEKLRRLKRKYRNAINRITAGKDFNFKSPHDQTTFEISHQIWGGTATGASVAAAATAKVNINTTPTPSIPAIPAAAVQKPEDDEDEDHINKKPRVLNSDHHHHHHHHETMKPEVMGKGPRENVEEDDFPKQEPTITTGVIEEAIRSCVSPMLKELFSSATNGFCNLGGGGVALNPVPLNCGGIAPVNLRNVDGSMDDKWRKQQILELEVYSKRVELVQEQIKSALEELKSAGTD